MKSHHRTAREWFQEAARCYVDNHQGCAWCGGSHRVHHTRRNLKQVYYCHGCDFQAGLDETTGKHFSVPGEELEEAGKLTMYEI